MSVIYLKHPIHGRKVATMELEAAADEKNGWVRYDVEKRPTAPVVQSIASELRLETFSPEVKIGSQTTDEEMFSNTLMLKNRGRPRKDAI